MLSQRWNPFRVCSAIDEIRSAYAQCAIKFVPRMLSIHILPLAEHARKFVPRMPSVRWNIFLACSVCDKIVSAYAQCAHAVIFENPLKIQNKMQISTIKILKNRLGTHLIGPKWKLFWKKFFGYLSKKIWFGVCSVTAKMFELQNSGENRRKRSNFFFEN